METAKERLKRLCLEKIEQNIAAQETTIEAARTAQKEDTKSSSGDKYETSREMMTQEIEKATVQLTRLRADKVRLLSIPSDTKFQSVEAGALITTTKGTFFLSISLGPVSAESETIQVISPTSPMGQLLLGKREGEKFELNGKEFAITQVT